MNGESRFYDSGKDRFPMQVAQVDLLIIDRPTKGILTLVMIAMNVILVEQSEKSRGVIQCTVDPDAICLMQ